jgi:hypothetical protein
MKRNNYTNEGTITEYKNGNINIKFSPDAIKDINSGRYSDIEVISWLLDSLDTYFISDEYCLSNYDMGATLYNCNSDLCYIISFSDIENILKAGKTLKLYGHTPDEYEKEDIEKFWNE